MAAVNQITNLQIAPGTSNMKSKYPQWYQRHPQRVIGEPAKFNCPFECSSSHLLNTFFYCNCKWAVSVPKVSFNFFPSRQCGRWSPTVRLYEAIQFKLMFRTLPLELHLLMRWRKRTCCLYSISYRKYRRFESRLLLLALRITKAICRYIFVAVRCFPK